MQKFQFKELFATVQEKNQSHINTFMSDLQAKSVSPTPSARKQTPVKQLKQLFDEPPTKMLMQRKKSLLKQLKTIETELKKVQNSRLIQNSRMKKKSESSEDYEKATRLISRMNKQRRQMQDRNRKKSQNIHLEVQKSLKKIEQYKQQTEKVKQQKKKEIGDRINDRKQALKMKRQYDKKANFLIDELQGYRVSLPNINLIKNPEEDDKVKQVKTLKRYKKSLFLQNIQMEELSKRRQLYLKEYEKKHARERQQLYGRKIRKSRVKEDNSTFVT